MTPLTVREVARVWAPLAASWILMGLELPLASAVVARLADPAIHLAAYGGVVLPVAMVIEAPIIMLLAASTALCRDWSAYRLIRRFMLTTSGALTLLHALVAFTPLFDLLVGQVLRTPEPVREPARLGLKIMLPWTASIAYRRLHQGLLIRAGRSNEVGIGTLFRLGALTLVLTLTALVWRTSGIVAAASGVTAGVLAEAVYIGIRVRSILRGPFRETTPTGAPLTFPAFLSFYVPLALTSLLHLLTMPIGAGALSRMPRPLESLAVWPVVSGLNSTVRSVGIAYNEVIVSLLDRPGAEVALRRFALLLGATTGSVLLLVALTPLARGYFEGLSGLEPELAAMGATALLFAWPLPALGVAQSWFQGHLVHARRTRAIPEGVAFGLSAFALVLAAGAISGGVTGVYVGLGATVAGQCAQVAWLRRRTQQLR